MNKINSEDVSSHAVCKDRRKYNFIHVQKSATTYSQPDFVYLWFSCFNEKETNQDREKGIIVFAAYRNEANIEGVPVQTHV